MHAWLRSERQDEAVKKSGVMKIGEKQTRITFISQPHISIPPSVPQLTYKPLPQHAYDQLHIVSFKSDINLADTTPSSAVHNLRIASATAKQASKRIQSTEQQRLYSIL